jgi:hypothetical protein
MCDFCDPYPPIPPRDNSGARVTAFTFWAVWTVILMSFAFWAGRASASELDTIRDAAWYAYHNRKTITWDGELDCDDNARFAHDYLAERGIFSTYDTCIRNGEGHVFLLVGELAIDNSSPEPISVAAVGCD